MSRVQGHLVTIVGCLISLASFCLLPYLAIADAAYTGLQLVTSGSLIPVPFPPAPNGHPPHFWLQNLPPIFTWVPLLLVVLLLLAAVGDLLITRHSESVRKGITRGILVVATLTLCCSLSSCISNLADFDSMSAHGDTIMGIGRGSLVTPGFGGLVLGLVVALIGSMMTLRAKRKHKKGN
jgi:hypothetical protein